MVGGGTWLVLLVTPSKNDCIEIPKTVTLIINWWTLPLGSLYLIGLLIFSFKMQNQIFKILLSLSLLIEKLTIYALVGMKWQWNKQIKLKKAKLNIKKKKLNYYYYYYYCCYYYYYYHCYYYYYYYYTVLNVV